MAGAKQITACPKEGNPGGLWGRQLRGATGVTGVVKVCYPPLSELRQARYVGRCPGTAIYTHPNLAGGGRVRCVRMSRESTT